MEDIRERGVEALREKESIFICFKGEERSRAITKVFKDKGLPARYFDEGTRKLATMSLKNIEKENFEDGNVFIIYDQGSSSEEFFAKEETERKLDECGIRYDEIGRLELVLLCRMVGEDLWSWMV